MGGKLSGGYNGLKNIRNGLKIFITTREGQKRPSLMIGDELGDMKVATFLNDGAAEDFLQHMMKLTEVKKDGKTD